MEPEGFCEALCQGWEVNDFWKDFIEKEKKNTPKKGKTAVWK